MTQTFRTITKILIFIIFIYYILFCCLFVQAKDERKPIDPVHFIKFMQETYPPGCPIEGFGMMYANISDGFPYWVSPQTDSDDCDQYLMVVQDQNTLVLNISPLLLEDGTVAAPSLAFINETSTGLYRPGTNQFGVSVGGIQHFVVGATKSYFKTTTGIYKLGIGDTDPDTLLTIRSSDTNILVDLEGGIGDYLTFGYSIAAGNAGAFIRCHNNRFRFISTNGKEMILSQYGKLALNTQEPAAWFHINSDEATVPFVYWKAASGQSADMVQILDNAESGAFIIDNNGNAHFYDNVLIDGNSEFEDTLITNGNWISGDGGNEGISIDNSGNVGINDSSPDTALEILSTTTPQLRLTNVDNTHDLDISIDASGDGKFSISGDNLIFQNDTDGTSGFQILDADGGTPIFNIDTANERTGFGIAAPEHVMHFYATGNDYVLFERATSVVDDNRLVFVVKHSTSGNAQAEFGVRMAFYIDNAASTAKEAASMLVAWESVSPTPNSYYAFSIMKSGSLVEGMRLTSDKWLGVGTTSPDASFQTIGGAYIGDDGTNYMEVKTDGEINLHGTARVWKCNVLKPEAVGLPATNPPAEDEYQGFSFHRYDRAIEEQVYYLWVIPTDFADGNTSVRGHYAFFVENPPSGTGDEAVVLGFEYKKISAGDVFDFSSGTTSGSITETISDGESAYKWHTTSDGTCNTAGWAVDDLIMFRFYRDATNVNDTYDNEAIPTDNDVWVGVYHLEYLSDKLGEAT